MRDTSDHHGGTQAKAIVEAFLAGTEPNLDLIATVNPIAATMVRNYIANIKHHTEAWRDGQQRFQQTPEPWRPYVLRYRDQLKKEKAA